MDLSSVNFGYLGTVATLVLEIVVVVVVVREIRALKRHHRVMKESVDNIRQAVETLGASMRLLERDKIYFIGVRDFFNTNSVS